LSGALIADEKILSPDDQQIGAVSAIGCVGKIKAGAFHPDLRDEHAEVTKGITPIGCASPG
jgi:hypothetical protein